MNEHLGTAKEICWFAMEMADELDRHQAEKPPLREVNFTEVKKLVIDEIRKRLDKIEKLPDEGYAEMMLCAKQFTHISNFSLIGFLKARYNV